MKGLGRKKPYWKTPSRVKGLNSGVSEKKKRRKRGRLTSLARLLRRTPLLRTRMRSSNGFGSSRCVSQPRLHCDTIWGSGFTETTVTRGGIGEGQEVRVMGV